MPRHAQRELEVFSRFVRQRRTAGLLDIDLSSVRKQPPPLPDIQCHLSDGTEVAFELVEAIDADLAQGLGGKLRIEEAFRAAYRSLPPLERQAVDAHVGDALLNVCFARELALKRRLTLVPAVLAELKRIDPASTEDHIPGRTSPLHGHVTRIMVARGHEGGPYIDAAAFAWYADPVLDAIDAKLGKHYPASCPVELLVYYDLQPGPGRVDWQAVAQHVANRLPGGPFRRMWVFDLGSGLPPLSFP
ncbi:MAG: hypothetical protein AB1505_29200 [Candidatus Latescibacterota bacterium]